MKTILVDDEAIALEVLEHMLSPYKEINIIGKYRKYTDALESIKEEKPDVSFLDIEMGEMNGLELGEIFIRELGKVEIVFVTAYSEYAVEAFELNAIDYLLKPIQEKRLLKAIGRLKEKVKINELQGLEENKLKLKVLSFGGFQVLDNEGNPLAWRTQKSKELFAYLWDEKHRAISKDLIIETIFPDREMEKASAILHTTVYQLRKSLERAGYLNGITYINESYQLDLPVDSDCEDLNEIMAMKTYNDEDIKKILKIYKGGFFEEGYHWAIEKQQSYKQLIISILGEFAEKQVEKGRLDLIIKVSLDKAYELDPFNESIVEAMINYYGKKNEINKLRDFFDNYKEELWDEMDLEPGKDIINRYNKYMESK